MAWSERQALLLRRVAAGEKINDQIDWQNVAEAIESVGQSERRSPASHVRNALEHLAKLEASPAPGPRAGWQDTVSRARSDIEDLLNASPSLRPKLDGIVAEQLPQGAETGRVLFGCSRRNAAPAAARFALQLGPGAERMVSAPALKPLCRTPDYSTKHTLAVRRDLSAISNRTGSRVLPARYFFREFAAR
jgi:hypothetical protein